MPQDPLQIEDAAGHQPGHRVLKLRGPVLISNLYEFQSMVRSDTSRTLILDLSGVPYIDSAGVGALVGAYVTHEKEGRKLILAGVTQRVRNTMEVTRVAQFFQFSDSVHAAETAAARA
jgi:anti-sigma B factor antagonist